VCNHSILQPLLSLSLQSWLLSLNNFPWTDAGHTWVTATCSRSLTLTSVTLVIQSSTLVAGRTSWLISTYIQAKKTACLPVIKAKMSHVGRKKRKPFSQYLLKKWYLFMRLRIKLHNTLKVTQNCIRKVSFLNQITILEPSLQSQLTAQIWTTSVWGLAHCTNSQPSDTSLSELLASFALFNIFHPVKPLQNLGRSKKNTQCMHCGWECNLQQTKRVIAKTTELGRYIKTAAICVLFSPI
jgi:hypothetical protein